MSVNNNLQREAVDYYLKLKYPVTLSEEHEGGFTAEIKELKGCLTQGKVLKKL